VELMAGYPIHLVNLAGRRVLVAGGGRVAATKLPALIAAGARVHLVAERFEEAILPLLPRLDLAEERAVSAADVAGAALVIAATDDAEVNRTLAAAARRESILVNAADDPSACDFFAPAIVERGPVTISVSTDGVSPLLAGQLRRLLEAIIPEGVKSAAELLARVRSKGLRGLSRRASLLRALADPRLTALVDRGDTDAAGEMLLSIAGEEQEPFPAGTVAIVGAGPGARALLTLRALDRIQRADVLLFDALVDREVLALAMPEARAIDVGRRSEQAGCRAKQFSQRLTEELMIHEARSGRRVVRLHAGDPLVFGRGGEEIDALTAAGVPFEVVPGVSSVMAAAAAASVPLTRRGESRGFTVRTGHDAEGYTRGELPVEEETTVVLMGLGAVRSIMEGLIAEGRTPDTPAMAVSRATLPDQRVVVATIATLAEAVESAKLEGPAALIVGDVVRRAITAREEAPRICGSRGS
jgi:uroporphyrin-III C-methyltransferase/precorrin-2 dehydrogenase/sirohydrochlorin ferrochelatase